MMSVQSLPTESVRSKETSAAQALVERLAALGVKYAFGILGGPIVYVGHALMTHPRIHCMLAQHEGGGAFAAMGRGFVREHRELPVCFGTSGPGSTNLMTGVAAADAERVPLFVLSGNVATHLKGKGAVQESFPGGLDTVRMFESITVKSVSVEDPARILEIVDDLYELSLQTLRPVHLNIPTDVAVAKIGVRDVPSAPGTEGRQFCGSEETQVALARFLSSERPMIYAGNGVKLSRLQEMLKNVAELHQLPVMVTAHGKGAFDELHPLYVGCFGIASGTRSMRFLEQYDPTACLFVGTSLNECSTAAWNPILERIPLKIQVDRDRARIGRAFSVEHPIVEDLDKIFIALANAKAQRGPFSWNTHGEILRAPPQFDMTREVHPQLLLQELNRSLPESCCVVTDIGNAMLWAIQELQVRPGQEFFVPMGLGSMGSGIGAAVGLQVGSPRLPVLCIAGDCSMLMSGAELHTASAVGLPVKVIVLNDGGHGTVAAGLDMLQLTGASVRFRQRVDFSLWARALHFDTHVLRTGAELAGFDWAGFWKASRPTLLDVHIDPTVPPPLDVRLKGLKNRGTPGLIPPPREST